MGSLFSAPKLNLTPLTTATTAVPTAASSVVTQAGADQTAELASAAGRASTILTSPLGTSTPATSKKTLLGQ